MEERDLFEAPDEEDNTYAHDKIRNFTPAPSVQTNDKKFKAGLKT